MNLGDLTITFGPLVPWPVLAGLAVVAAIALAATWWLRARGAGWRTLAVLGLLAALLNPTAVFAVSDHEAEFVYQAASELGKEIPRDLSVVGFADLDFAAAMEPPLTTMRQRPHEIGRLSARLILDRIDGTMPGDEPTTIKVPAELIVRHSTGPAI